MTGRPRRKPGFPPGRRRSGALAALGLGLALFAGAAAAADGVYPTFVLRDDPVSALDRAALAAWGEDVGRGDWSHYECAPLAEHRQVAVCLFSHSLMMSRIFDRAAFEIEAPRYAQHNGGNLGIDLRLDDLLAYGERRRAAAATGEAPLGLEERDFLETVLPLLRRRLGARAVVATAWGNLGTLEHELLHARYFSSAEYRQAVADFWHDSLNEEQRTQVRREFSSQFNPRNEDLMINEFQAYLLQSRPSLWIAGLRAELRSRLLDHLARAGLGTEVFQNP